jgi:two-component system response regulator HydG
VSQRGHILVAADDRELCELYAGILAREGHRVDQAHDGDETLRKVPANAYDLLVTDLVFPPTDGIRVLQEVKRVRPSTLVVLVSGLASAEDVLSGFRAGAFDFLVKPVEPDHLAALADRAVALRATGEQRRRLAQALEDERLRVMELQRRLGPGDPFREIVGSSPAIQRLVDTLREVARTESTVLLSGESGTGKGLAARAIHRASARHAGPFVEANCVVYSEDVLHSELFGHERGAFTGAAKLKRGRFEIARGGTIFLDEIGDISPATQLRLLRVLQDRTFERVGGEETFEADTRLIAATNRDLAEATRRGAFRSDLYYRLNVIPVHLPPLREHAEDIPVLSQHFLRQCAERQDRDVDGFSDEAMEALARYSWPGNVRELENMVERLAVLSKGRQIGIGDLPPSIREHARGGRLSAAGTLQDLERRRIEQVLADTDGNKKLAAERLGIHRSTLYAKMRRYGMTGEGSRSVAQ